MRRAPAAACALTLVLLAAVTGGARAQSAPPRVVLETGVGGGRHQPTCRRCDGGVDAIATITGHLAAGASFGPRRSAYLSYDTGAILDFGGGGGGDGYGYTTVFAELAPRSAARLAVRVGAGYGDGTADRGSLYGRGVIARAGVALRTRQDRRLAAVTAADLFRGVSGRYGPHGRLPSDARPAFRPFTFRLSVALRVGIPIGS